MLVTSSVPEQKTGRDLPCWLTDASLRHSLVIRFAGPNSLFVAQDAQLVPPGLHSARNSSATATLAWFLWASSGGTAGTSPRCSRSSTRGQGHSCSRTSGTRRAHQRARLQLHRKPRASVCLKRDRAGHRQYLDSTQSSPNNGGGPPVRSGASDAFATLSPGRGRRRAHRAGGHALPATCTDMTAGCGCTVDSGPFTLEGGRRGSPGRNRSRGPKSWRITRFGAIAPRFMGRCLATQRFV